jgi:predicted nucleotidyltransferase
MEKMAAVVQMVCDAVPRVRAIYLFGSRAGGASHRQSDYDFAVLADAPIDAVYRWELAGRLADLVRAEVDLVDLFSASTVMRVQVVSSGQVIYDADPTARSLFEAMALSAYARLNEERRGILEDVRARGTIYG